MVGCTMPVLAPRCASICAAASARAMWPSGCVAWACRNSFIAYALAGGSGGFALAGGGGRLARDVARRLDGFLQRLPGGVEALLDHRRRQVLGCIGGGVFHRRGGELGELLRECAPPLHRVH